MGHRRGVWHVALLCFSLLAASAQVRGGAPPDVEEEAAPGSWYGGVRGGASYVHRNPFEYGQVGPDSNDAAPAVTLAATRGPEEFDLNTWGWAGEMFVGRHLTEKVDAELRFGLSAFSESDHFFFPATDSGTNLLFPYLDAGMTPAPGRPRRAGIYGVRFRDRDPATVSVDYDARFAEGGLDFVFTQVQTERTQVQFVAGPAVTSVTQDFDQRVAGSAIGGWAKPTVVLTKEDIEELYGGLKVGVRGSHDVSDVVSLVGQVNALLLYGRAELDARQNIAAGQTVIKVDDSENHFAPRVDVLTGLNWRLGENVRVGFFYQLGVWFNAATVENPELMLVFAEGNNRWTGNRRAHLTTETLIIHTGMFEFLCEF